MNRKCDWWCCDNIGKMCLLGKSNYYLNGTYCKEHIYKYMTAEYNMYIVPGWIGDLYHELEYANE